MKLFLWFNFFNKQSMHFRCII